MPPRTIKIGWGLIGSGYWHLLVRPSEQPQDRRLPARYACGVDAPPPENPERQPGGGCCAKCKAYAAKQHWL